MLQVENCKGWARILSTKRKKKLFECIGIIETKGQVQFKRKKIPAREVGMHFYSIPSFRSSFLIWIPGENLCRFYAEIRVMNSSFQFDTFFCDLYLRI